MPRLDPHSFADSDQPSTDRFDLRARVNFRTRTIEATVTLYLRESANDTAGPIDLDTRDLSIEAVTDEAGAPLLWELSADEHILGSRLRVMLPSGARSLTIRYATSPNASALQWLEPMQTAGGVHPFLFSQCQAIHARSVVPLQDTPRGRVTYTAELTVPAALRGLMAAAHRGRVIQGDVAVESWEMPQPIAPYLFALAVGELASRDLGPRSAVFAEPTIVDKAAIEFADVDAMITSAEKLFGPYDWERFDILIMPPSFPYGGMENPRLTFLTPTLLAGDKSLVNVLAHELAHSWTGNLVGAADAESFWLNEGFTVFAERRIIEALEGSSVSALHAAIGRLDLVRACSSLPPELTLLRTHLQGVDPDEAFSKVPYEKGFLFLRTLEESVGRESFDAFLAAYISTFKWKTLCTEDFAAFVSTELPDAVSRVNMDAWLHGPGIPAGAPEPHSSRLDVVTALGATVPGAALARTWTPTEWVLYLEALPRPAPAALCAELDQRFALTKSANMEVCVSWLQVALHAGHALALPRAQEVLATVGRMKYLKPLYRALMDRPATRDLARTLFAENAIGYHPIARAVIEPVVR